MSHEVYKIECDGFGKITNSAVSYLQEKLGIDIKSLKDPHNFFENYNQYAATINAINAFLNNDPDNFKNWMEKTDKDYACIITIQYNGIPYNPYSPFEPKYSLTQISLLELIKALANAYDFVNLDTKNKCLNTLEEDFAPDVYKYGLP